MKFGGGNFEGLHLVANTIDLFPSLYAMPRSPTVATINGSTIMHPYCIPRATTLKINSTIAKTKDADAKANKSHPYHSQDEIDESATQTYVVRLLPDATIFSEYVACI